MYNTGSWHKGTQAGSPLKGLRGKAAVYKWETDAETQYLGWNIGSISGRLAYLGSRMLGSSKPRKAITMEFQWLPPHKALRLFLNAAQSQPN